MPQSSEKPAECAFIVVAVLRLYTFKGFSDGAQIQYKSENMKDPSSSMPLGRIDRRILRLLQRDGRLSNADLAKQANVISVGEAQSTDWISSSATSTVRAASAV
jgi:hypothetical protein